MEIVQGSHGTCQTFADGIRSSGFQRKPGLRGGGIYFWRRSKYWQRFAKSWYHQRLDAGIYPDASGCAVLIADLECAPAHYLDLADPDVRDRHAELISRMVGNSLDLQEISRAYDFIFGQIEFEARSRIKVIRVEVPPPSKQYTHYYNFKALGSVSCLIARDRDIIKKVVQLSDEETSML